MQSNFNLPSVDHLVEGVDYRIVDWSFADAAPAPDACPKGEKMVFGVCRKVGGSGEKDFDSSKKTSQEEGAEAEAKKQGSEFKNNKQVAVGNKKMGWAMKGGKPVMVEWGSVAGDKKVGPKQPAAKTAAAPSKSQSAAQKLTQKANDPALSSHDRSVAGIALSVADRSAYKAGGGNAAAQRGMGSNTQQVVEQGRKNLGKMDQGKSWT